MTLDPKKLYFVVFGCPVCGRRTRGSTFLRARDAGFFEDMELMLTESGGHRRLRNSRAPLWDSIADADPRTSLGLGRVIGDLLHELERRLRDAEREASRARYSAWAGRRPE